MATELRQLRRWVGSGLGEFIRLQATADSGDLDRFVSLTDLQIPDAELAGRDVYYASSNNPATADNVGTVRVLYTNTESEASITVVPPWPAAPMTGDVVELYNARGYSVRVSEIEDKLNQLIAEVSADGGLVTSTTPANFSFGSPYIDVPTTWTWLLGVEFTGADGLIHRPAPSDIIVRTWTNPNQVEIRSGSRSALGSYTGNTAWLVGATAFPQLSSNDSKTIVDPAWLVDQAVAELRKQSALRWGDPATALALQNIELVEAEKARPRADFILPTISGKWRVNQNIELGV